MPGAVRAYGTQIITRKSPEGGSPDPWIKIGGVKDIEGPQKQREAIDVTTHDSPDNYVEKLMGIKDGGPLSFEIELYDNIGASPPQLVGIEFAFESDDLYDFAVIREGGTVNGFGTPPATGDAKCWRFKGFVSRIGPMFPVKESARQTIEISISGKITWTSGS